MVGIVVGDLVLGLVTYSLGVGVVLGVGVSIGVCGLVVDWAAGVVGWGGVGRCSLGCCGGSLGVGGWLHGVVQGLAGLLGCGIVHGSCGDCQVWAYPRWHGSGALWRSMLLL